jgi:hypothetical protein
VQRDGENVAPWRLRIGGPFVALLLALAFALLGLRLFRMIDRYAVNVLFWDQWDLVDAFLGDASAWELFRWQHGPHRQGIAFPLTRLVMEASAWNVRAEAFWIGALVVLSAALALWLRRRLFGPFTPMDVAIPLLLLSPAQYAIFLHIPNASHGAAPLLLLVTLCLACTLARRGARCAALVCVGFPLVHTGFGLVAGVLVPVLLASECVEAWRDAGARAARWPAVAVALSLASLGVFFAGYAFDPAVDDFAFPSPQARLYPRYAALMLAHALGAKGTQGPAALVGFAALALLIAVAAVHAVALFTLRGDARRRSAVIATLAGFGLLFCAGAAVGRVSLGLGTAQSSRYFPLVAPALLGVYLHLLTLRSPQLRGSAAVLATLAIAVGSLKPHPDDARFIAVLAFQKQRWVDVYVETGSVRRADEAAQRRIYPHPPETTQLEEKLAALRERRLGFFAEPVR